MKWFITAALSFCYSYSEAQYVFSPGITYTQYNDTSELTYGGIDITNTGADTLLLKWTRIFLDTSLGNYFDFCESGNCFIGVPLSGDVTPIAPGKVGWLKNHYWSGKSPGTSTAKIYVYEPSAPNNGDTLTYKLIVNSQTGIHENSKDIEFTIFPNPSSGEVFIQHQGIAPQNAYISDSMGNLIRSFVSGTINFLPHEKGIFFLHIETSKGRIVKKLYIY